MPRKITTPVESLFNYLDEHKHILIVNNKLVAPGNSIWKKISSLLENKITPKTIYTICNQNRYKIMDRLKLNNILYNDNQNNISNKNNEIENSFDCSTSSYSSDSSSSVENENNTLKFAITLSKEEWHNICTISATYKCTEKNRPNRKTRTYLILKPGWTDIINKHFYEHTRLQCCISFKRSKIYENGFNYAKIIGSCVECSSKFIGVIKNKPQSDMSRVHIQCSYIGQYLNKHIGEKRKLTGINRQNAVTLMCERKIAPSQVRLKEARRIMNFGDLNPSHLPTSNAYRIARYRNEKKGQLHPDPRIALEILKQLYFPNIIRDIGLNKFFVHYWSNSQLHVYNAYQINASYSKVSIDATGSVVRKLNLQDGNKTGAIFLYEITVCDQNTNKQYSVGNMLSERHDTVSIYLWLIRWKLCGFVCPDEIVTDMSAALMSAVIQTFTNFKSILEYIEECGKIFTSRPVVIKLPETYIRSDLAHVRKLISSWSCFTKQSRKPDLIKQFYTRAIGLIIICNNIDTAKLLLTAIFTVALSVKEGKHSITGEMTPCEVQKLWLREKMSLGSESSFINDEEILEEEFHQDDCGFYSSNTNPFVVWAKSIQLHCENILQASEYNLYGDHDNHQYLPEIVPIIVEFCKLLPMWSAIMLPYYKKGHCTASSAPVESSFNNLKHRIFQSEKLPLRVDKFIKLHIEAIEEQMIDAASVKCTANDNIAQTMHPENNNDEYLAEENWRGQVYSKKSFISPELKWKNIDLTKSGNVKKISFLKNGNRDTLKPISIEKVKFIFKNTCPFDSLLYVLCTAYSDSTKYLELVNRESSVELFKLILLLSKSNATPACYRLRGHILKDIFPAKTLPQNINLICCETNAKSMSIFLLENNYPTFKITSEKCSECGNIRDPIKIGASTYTLDLDLNEEYFTNIIEQDISHMQNFYCECSAKLNAVVDISKYHLFIEPLNSAISENSDFGVPWEVELKKLPINLKINNINYNLRGVIAFKGASKLNEIGHYFCCARRFSGNWELFDDLMDCVKQCPESTKLNIHLLIYTI